MTAPFLYEPTWERMIRAVEKVRERLDKAVAALEAAGIPYAVIGGHAVANWVSRVNPGGVRNTRDVDLLIRRADFDAARRAMETVGFVYTHTWGIDVFREADDVDPSEGVHLLFAGERVKPNDPVPLADVADSEPTASFRVIGLEPLVRMKLVSFRRKDQAHLVDMARFRLIDDTWPDRFPQPLADRLRDILLDPDSSPQTV